MKSVYTLLIACVVIATGCGVQFSTHYDRIEENRVRNLAFVYDNHGLAEGAPGDTVQCAAFFSGEPVTSVEWTVTTSLIINSFGADTFADTVSLDRYILPGTYREFFGGETDSVQFKFRIPDNIISAQFDENSTIGALLPPGMADTLLPEAIRAIKPLDIIETIESFSAASGSSSPLPAVLPDSIVRALPSLFQVLTVNMRLFATINGHYRVESTFSVRYNARFNAIMPVLPVNHNPVVHWIRCYRIKAERIIFDPVNDSDLIDTVYRCYPEQDTILIDVGYHYFFVADSAVASLDSGYSMTDPSSSRQLEMLSYEWFYQNIDTVDGSLDSLMVLDNAFGGSSVELLPSVETRLAHFNLWLVTYDSFLGEKLRPVGFEVKCIKGIFAYSEAYRKRYR
jgi:hypothetical protein